MTNSNTTSPTLAINNVSCAYGKKPILTNVSLRLNRGDFVALLGPNGAGKTTLFSLICRLNELVEGSIEVCGQSINLNPSSALAKIGVVFQQPTLDLGLTVQQNLMYFAALRGLSRQEAKARIGEEIERLNIGDISGTTIRKLNGGHRRRVEIARALIHRPAILLLDEPTVGLDMPTRQQFVEYVHGLSKERGVSVLWATHLIDEVDVNDDYLAILHLGKMVATGQVQSMIKDSNCQTLAEFYRMATEEQAYLEEV